MKTIFTLLACMVITITQAQWTTDTAVNTLVTNSETGDMQALGTSTGETYVVFWKPVAAPTNYELRMQVLDADGNQTLGSDGMLLSDQIPMSTFTVIWKIVVDTNDNIYVGVTGTGGGDPAFVFKLDTAGNHLWNADGVSVGGGNLVTVLPLTSGEAIVSWLSSTGAVMQKYNANGVAVWPSTQIITSGTGFAAPANLFEMAGGEYVVVFHRLLSGINSNLYAQRYDVDGNAVWAAAMQLSDKLTAFNRLYTGVHDGDVVYMGYFAASNNRFDSFLQRINPDGTLPWGINGADFDTSQTNFETDTEIAFNTGSTNVWAICRTTDSGQSMTGEYIQKFDKDSGNRLFTDSAKEVFAIGDEKIHAGKLHLLDDQPWFLINNGVDNGASPTTLEATYLDENGDFAWPEETKPLATFAANKSRIHYTTPAQGQSVAVFIEDKGDGAKIYAQNVVEEVALSVNDVIETTVSYNNPVSDILQIKATMQIELIELYDITGKRVLIQQTNGNDVSVAMSNLTAGMYILQLKMTEGYAKGIKIIKR
ncbi:T9SS type A sorting domain-containing protein [Rasiella sp. SM2506]|uniref:T9SS type A sorting domain-containing protein n=1 Tax=Rasiella sp. SM2506 TaxID=3423914 RepID=UPI003D7A6CC4